MNRFLALTELQLLEETERIAVQGEAVNKERRPHELPSGCEVPYIRETLGIGMRDKLTDMLLNMGSDWKQHEQSGRG